MAERLSRIERLGLVSFACLCMLDIVITGIGLYSGHMVELNPFYNWITDIPTLLAVAIVAKCIYIIWLYFVVGFIPTIVITGRATRFLTPKSMRAIADLTLWVITIATGVVQVVMIVGAVYVLGTPVILPISIAIIIITLIGTLLCYRFCI